MNECIEQYVSERRAVERSASKFLSKEQLLGKWVNKDREQSPKYEIHIRSSSKKEWQILGFVGTDRPIPELEKIHKAKLYSYRLTEKQEPMKQEFNQGMIGFRTKNGTIIWE